MGHSDSRSLTIAPPERIHAQNSRDLRVSSPFIVQLAASHAGIGPYRIWFREGPALAAALYRAADIRDRSRV